MLRMFRTINGQVEQIQKPENGSWLCLSDPTDVELANVSMETGVDLADLRAPLDDEERSRVDVEDDYTMIIVDIPTVEERGGRDWYETIPLSIIITQSAIITVCMQDTPVLHPFMEGTIRGFNTYMKTRFILQILYRNATMYLRYLRIIDRESDKLELKLRHSMQNREILMLLELSKTLVYFTTSLKSNEIVMEKLTTLPRIKQYPEDEDLLDDVITENKRYYHSWRAHTGGETKHGVESRRHTGQRGSQAIRSIIAEHADDPTATTLLAVGHGSWIVATVAVLLDMDPDDLNNLGAMRNAFWTSMSVNTGGSNGPADPDTWQWKLDAFNQGPAIAALTDWENGPKELRGPNMPLWKPIVQ